MICPNCGLETGNKTLCDQCGKPTEFVKRTNVRPEPIPGERPFVIKRSKKAPQLLGLITLLAFSACLGLSLVIWKEVRAGEGAKLQFDLNLPEGYSLVYPEDIPENWLWQPESPKGLSYLGWNTEEDGSGTMLEADQVFSLPLKDSVVLYAQWEKTEEAPETQPETQEREES